MNSPKLSLFISLILGFLVINVNDSSALNLSLNSVYHPDVFAELLDLEGLPNHGMAMTGVGGLCLFDLSRDNIDLRSHYSPGYNLYNSWGDETLLVVTARQNGLILLDITDLETPIPLYSYSLDGMQIEDARIVNGEIWAVLHDGGLLVMNMDDTTDANILFEDELVDAWAIESLGDSLIFIADGVGGIAVIDNRAENPEYIQHIITGGSAIDLALSDTIMVVAEGENGAELFHLFDDGEVSLAHHLETPSICAKVSINGNRVALADWEQSFIYSLNGDLLAWKYSEERGMAVHLDGQNDLLVADWTDLRHFDFGIVHEPDLEISPRNLFIPVIPENASLDTFLIAKNNGGETLEIESISTLSIIYDFTPESMTLEPQESDTFFIHYLHDPEQRGNITARFHSNDPDDPPLKVRLHGHGGTLHMGEPVPDFTVNLLDGSSFTLSEHQGNVIVLALWAFW